MKRFLSIMLTVMLVLSSFVMVSADEPSQVITVNDTFDYSFNETFDGNCEISADVYVAQGATATITAKNGETEVGTVNADTAKAGEWQTVKLTVNDAFDSLAFTAEGGKAYVKSVKVDKVFAKNLVYDESFDHYSVNDKPLNSAFYTKIYTGVTTGNHSLTLVESAVADIDGRRALNFYNPSYGEDGVIRYTTEGNPDENAQQNKSITEPVDGVNREKYPGNEHVVLNIPNAKDATHLIAEFEVYNAANAKDEEGNVLDELWFAIAKTASYHCQSSEISVAKLGGSTFTLTGRTIDNKTGDKADVVGNHNAEPKNWEKVIYEVKREMYDSNGDGTDDKWHVTSNVTYGGQTLTNDTYSAYADDFGKIFISMNYKYGGRFYIDNLKVYNLVEVDDAYVTRYEENFDGETNSISKYKLGWYTSGTTHTTTKSTFTAATGSHNSTTYGRLYNAGWYNSTTPTRYQDDGVTLDTAENVKQYGTSDTNNEYFYYDIPGMTDGWGGYAEGAQKRTRISFKYYLPETSKGKDGTVKDGLNIGMTVSRLTHINSSEAVRLYPIGATSTEIGKRDYSDDGSTCNTTREVVTSSGTKKWIPVVLEVVSTGGNYTSSGYRYAHEVTYTSLNQKVTTVIGDDDSKGNPSGYDLNRFIFGVPYMNGGTAYIDDIKVETSITSEEDYAEISTANDSVYSWNADLKTSDDEFEVTAGTFANDAQTLTIIKMPGNTESVQIVTAVFNGNVLDNAVVNEVSSNVLKDYAETSVSLTNKVKLPDDLTGYSFKVFVFDTAEGLKPLADMFIQ